MLLDDTRLNLSAGLFYLSWRELVAEPDAQLADLGLGRVHHRLLFAIGRRPRLTVSELCTVLDVSRQALNRPLRQLQEAGLVHSEPDGRTRLLTLTASGAELESSLTGAQRRILREVFEKVGPEATAAWHMVMRELALPGIERVPDSLPLVAAFLQPSNDDDA